MEDIENVPQDANRTIVNLTTLSQRLSTAPGVAPSIKSTIIILPAKIRKEGIAVPVALPQPIKGVVLAFSTVNLW